MKKGLIYGFAAWLLSLLVMPLLAPLIFHGGNMQALGHRWVSLSFFVIALPAFVIGCLQERRMR